ncbi:hypothetical protein BpHYR1_031738 [Brachionus plicatilis]|uniref:Uncharacterized protein n=1 Tax=Brachionus plicatilis TaxID=10195 RepID=A0A3M7PY42_BRAPC|nr:hypothetical protein BpHYR1_031738 [Brachionus plicatilis]
MKIHNVFCNAGFYPHQAFNFNEEEITKSYRAIIFYQDVCKEAFQECKNQTAQKICRALDVIHISLHNSSSSRLELDLRLYSKENLDEVLDLSRIQSIIEKLPLNTRLEVLSQYKALPEPDLDYFGAMERHRKLYQEMQARNSRNFDEEVFSDIQKI